LEQLNRYKKPKKHYKKSWSPTMAYETQSDHSTVNQFTEKSREVFSDHTGIRKYAVYLSLLIFIGLIYLLVVNITSVWLNRISLERNFAKTSLQTKKEVDNFKIDTKTTNGFIAVDSLEVTQNADNIESKISKFNKIIITGPEFKYTDNQPTIEWKDKLIFDEWYGENKDLFKNKEVYLALKEQLIFIQEELPSGYYVRVPYFAKLNPQVRAIMMKQLSDWLPKFSGLELQVNFENIDSITNGSYTQFISEVKSSVLGKEKKLLLARDVDNWIELVKYESEVADIFIAQTYHPFDGTGAVREENVLAHLLNLPKEKVWLEFNSGVITRGIDENGYVSFTGQDYAYSVYKKMVNKPISIDTKTGVWSTRLEGQDYDSFVYDNVSYINQTVIFNDLFSKFIRGVNSIGLGEQNFGEVFNDKSDVSLSKIIPFDAAVKTGNGEVFSYKQDTSIGERKVEIKNGFVTKATITKTANSTELTKLGGSENKINLSFDDGPDPEFTPKVLDILREKGVKATFFVIGEKARQYPNLIRQIQREGHEIANHTFTHPSLITELSDQALKDEILSTELAIQETVNVKTKYFRSPYSVVNSFYAKEEARVSKIATELGYYIVGKDLDSYDWKGEGSESILSHFTPAAIKASTQILMHDGGGNRQETIRSLSKIIDTVRANGKQFATVDEMTGQVTPVATPTTENRQTEFYETFNYSLYNTLFYSSTFVIVMVIVRYLIIIIGLLAYRLRGGVQYTHSFYGLVTVIIPAYNEEKVVIKTIQSILNSDYKNIEIIFVNDGSTDDTLKVVKEYYGKNKKIIVLDKPNGGKANALNYGIQFAKGEVVICLDADTVFLHSTIDKLVRHFSNRRVGGVAGTVLPGNSKGFLTNAQKIEYITSQYNEKLSFSSLGMLNVVPGAIGAWRKGLLKNIGGYHTDTLAEDTDLTLRVQKLGWKVIYEPNALSYTEIPESFGQLSKQRFRWLYGTLQALWKNRTMILNAKYGLMGVYMLPSSIFNFFFILLFPVVNIASLVLATQAIYAYFNHTWNLIAPEQKVQMYFFVMTIVLYFAVEVAMSLFAFVRSKKTVKEIVSMLFYMPFQILVYRLMLVGLTLKAILFMFTGSKVGWGFLKRKGNVKVVQS
jgi:peptidoglycan-N-acetylglucosamine deacetylase